MAIAARTATTASSAGATSIAPSKPTGLADGDVVYIATCVAGGSGIGTAPNVSGFTEVSSKDNGTAIRVSLLRKVIVTASGEPSTYSISWDGTSRAAGAVCQAYSGMDTTTPEDATAVTNSGAGTTINSASGGITTVTDNAWYLYLGGLSGSSTTIPAPTSYTEEGQVGGSRIELAHLLQASHGSSGTVSSGNLGSSKTWASIMSALRPTSTGVNVSGTAALQSLISSGSIAAIDSVSGTAALGSVAAAASINAIDSVSGTATLDSVTSSASIGVVDSVSGTAALASVAASGSVQAIASVSGTAALDAVTVSGNIGQTFISNVSGTAALGNMAAAGSLSALVSLSGTATYGSLSITGGVATIIGVSGTAALGRVTASGVLTDEEAAVETSSARAGIPSPIPGRIGTGRPRASTVQPSGQRVLVVAADVRRIVVRENPRVIRV